MSLTSDLALATAKRKLQLLEQSYAEARADNHEDDHIREVTMESLMRLINQFKEEIVRYEVHQAARR
jgi:hypothetical protein